MSSRLTISLAALAANYQLLCDKAWGRVAGVVKADAYGLGANTVVKRLLEEGCTEFFVASAAEGMVLRRAFADVSIYVLEGALPDNIDGLVTGQLVPVLNTLKQCQTWASTQLPAAVHIDTGLQRLGLNAQQALELAATAPFPIVLGVSHFANADDPGHISVVNQLQQGINAHQVFRTKNPGIRLSLCNSAGILGGLGPEDLGRAGIALYGGNPYCDLPNPMQPVVKFEARILQQRKVSAGVPVGYGGTYIATRASRLVIVSAGYADGVPRLLSNQGQVAIRGQKFPMVGRVSMDLLAVDATGLAEGDLTEGGWVEILGALISVDDVAKQAQTIAYEVLCRLGTRAQRIYSTMPI